MNIERTLDLRESPSDEPGFAFGALCSPWENGYNESFNGKLRDELLNWEIFSSLREATVLVEQWRTEYNRLRPHSSMDYRPPAPEAVEPPLLELAV